MSILSSNAIFGIVIVVALSTVISIYTTSMTEQNQKLQGVSLPSAKGQAPSQVSTKLITTTNATTSTTNPPTATPIKHLVVIYQENVAFDHYFATYPKAANPDPLYSFHASPNTPSINGLTTAGLLTNNTNLANPFRLDRSQAGLISICNPDHDYSALQKSFNGGLMDKFVENSGLES